MFGSKSVVDLLVRGGKIEIAVALNGDFAVNSAFGFCDLLFDSAQAASGPIIGVLEVGHRIRGCVFARIACRGLCPDLAVGVGFTRDFPPPGFTHLRHGGVSPTKCSADLHLSMLACSKGVKLFVCGGRVTISILVARCTCRCRKPRVYRGGFEGLGFGSPYQIRKI